MKYSYVSLNSGSSKTGRDITHIFCHVCPSVVKDRKWLLSNDREVDMTFIKANCKHLLGRNHKFGIVKLFT